VPVDADGLNIDAGVKLSRKARAAFVAPSHQYPLGVMMSASRRLQLLEWAQRAGAWLIEDDYDSEFRYDSMPIASLQGLDRNAHVIYVGTFSKVMFPSLRLGYLVAPRDLVERFAAMRQAIDICPADLTQAVAAEFIREGHFARHIRRMRPVYAERRLPVGIIAVIHRENPPAGVRAWVWKHTPRANCSGSPAFEGDAEQESEHLKLLLSEAPH
jgi:GntR family transcriptional regulator/MocR family aminotransferase